MTMGDDNSWRWMVAIGICVTTILCAASFGWFIWDTAVTMVQRTANPGG